MTFSGFIIGMIILGIGFVFVWKTEWFLINFGRIGFAEDHLGTSGGSRLFYKLAGVLLIIIGIMYAFDMTDSVLLWIVENIFGLKQEPATTQIQ